MSAVEENWPSWPGDGKSQRIVDVQVSCSPDELFTLLYAPKSPYVAKSQEKIGNKDYTEASWSTGGDTAKKASNSKSPLKPGDYKGLSRKTVCSGSGMGMKYTNTELQRCLEAAEGGPFEVEAIVHTTATYGDRFRPILKHRVTACPAGCFYTVDYALVYISSTNSFLKKAIERGAINGVTKNFEILMEVLEHFKPVKPREEEPAASGALTVDEDKGAEAVPYLLPWWSPRICKEGVQLMEVPSSWLKLKVGLKKLNDVIADALQSAYSASPNLQSDEVQHMFRHSFESQSRPPGFSVQHSGRPSAESQAGTLATLLASALLLVVVASLLFLLQASQTSCSVSNGPAARLCRIALSALDVPMSLRQVLTAGGLLLLANAIFAALAARILDGLSQTASHVKKNSQLGAVLDVLDHPAVGVRFEGFEQSLKQAADNLAEGEAELRRRASEPANQGSSNGATRSRGTQIRDNLRDGLKSLMEPIKRPPKQVTAANPSSPRVASAFAAASEPEALQRASRIAADGSARLNMQSAPSDASSSAIFSDEDDLKSPAGTSKRASTGGGGFRDYMNPGGLLDKTENMFAQWSGMNQKTQKPTTPQSIASPTPKEALTGYEHEEMSSSLPATVAAMELADLSPRDPEELLGVPVEEEVYENERYQPFRGWGHAWPGHFLPTDRVGHWSIAEPLSVPSLDSSSFDEIAPKLKKGWEWVEEGWQIDMRSLKENGVDEEGWSYAVDFPWIQWPPVPGSGRFRKVRDYVRRRRWFRTRQFSGIPLQESPSRGLPLSAPSSSAPAMTSLLSEALSSSTNGQSEKGQPLSQGRKSGTGKDAAAEKGVQRPPLPSRTDSNKSVNFPAQESGKSPSRSASCSPAKATGKLDTSDQRSASGSPEKRVGKSRSVDEGHLERYLSGPSISPRGSLQKPRTSSEVPRQASDVSGSLSNQQQVQESSRKGFADRMSSMLAAASVSLRQPNPKPRSARASSRGEEKPELVRESAPTADCKKQPAGRTGSEDLDLKLLIPDLVSYFGVKSDGKSSATKSENSDDRLDIQHPGAAQISRAHSTQKESEPSSSSQPGDEPPRSRRASEGATELANEATSAPFDSAIENSSEGVGAARVPSGNLQRTDTGVVDGAAVGASASNVSTTKLREIAPSPSAAAITRAASTIQETVEEAVGAPLSRAHTGAASVTSQDHERGEQGLAKDDERQSETADLETESQRSKPSLPLRQKSSPFAASKLPDLEAPPVTEASGAADELTNRRLAHSVPATATSPDEAAENLPRAMSADEASVVIQQAREAVEQVQRELHAMLPFIDPPDARNGKRH